MKLQDWSEKVHRLLINLSDRDYQLRSWMGLGPEISSPDELTNQLLDDLLFDEFVRCHLPGRAQTVATHLIKKLIQAASQRDSTAAPSSIIDQPDWSVIRSLASKILEEWPSEIYFMDDRGESAR